MLTKKQLATHQEVLEDLAKQLQLSPSSLEFIKSYRIKHALPLQLNQPHRMGHDEKLLDLGIVIAGEFFEGASINAALKTGVLAARSCLKYCN